MALLIKLILFNVVVIVCALIGKRFPSTAGLLAVMPLTGLAALLVVFDPATPETAIQYTRGALWGIPPSILFFLVAYLCFKRELSLPIVLSASFAVWLLGACVHQFFVR